MSEELKVPTFRDAYDLIFGYDNEDFALINDELVQGGPLSCRRYVIVCRAADASLFGMGYTVNRHYGYTNDIIPDSDGPMGLLYQSTHDIPKE